MLDSEAMDPERSLAAAEELARLDRTSRQTYTNLARGQSARLLIWRGAVVEGMTLWRESVRAWVDQGDHAVLSIAMSGMAGGMAGTDPLTAIEFGALAESEAIAHLASFATISDLTPLLESHPDEVAAARARVRDMDYDEAVAHLDALIVRLIADATVPADEGA